MLDARERRRAGSATVTGDNDVVGEGLGDTRSDGAYPEGRDQLDADRSTGIDALQVVDELCEIFDGVDVVVRWRADEHDAGLRVTQACDQLRDLVGGELSAF